MMTGYELVYRLGEWSLPVLYGKVRRDLKRLIQSIKHRPARILDVGARKSPYSVGLPVEMTLLDIPRQGEIMEGLNLGFASQDLDVIRTRRSNIVAIYLQDMTQCTLADASFDGVVCVEVIEHIPDDEAFVEQIARVLKPGGWAYFTTPNGDYVKNEPPDYNPDHVRHYKRVELRTLLEKYFCDVTITYGVKTGKHRYKGLRSISLRRPFQAVQTMLNNVVSRIESRGLDEQANRTAHLFAVVWKETG